MDTHEKKRMAEETDSNLKLAEEWINWQMDG